MAEQDLFGGFAPKTNESMMHGWIEQACHFYPLLVQFEDTDAGGIVYHANYLSYAERGRSGWLRLLGISQTDFLENERYGFVVRKASLDYQRPARLGDEVIIETKMISVTAARMRAEQIIRGVAKGQKKITDGHIFANVEVEIVMVNAQGRPIRFPSEIYEKMVPSGI